MQLLACCLVLLHPVLHNHIAKSPNFNAPQHAAFISCVHAKTKIKQLTCQDEYATLYIPH